MTRKRKLEVTKQSDTGENLRFKDPDTLRYMSKKEAIKAVETGTYSDYHIRTSNGKKYIASNPDKSTKNNLD